VLDYWLLDFWRYVLIFDQFDILLAKHDILIATITKMMDELTWIISTLATTMLAMPNASPPNVLLCKVIKFTNHHPLVPNISTTYHDHHYSQLHML